MRKKKIYREEMWLRDEACSDVITKAWEEVGDISSKLKRTASQLTMWGRTNLGI